MNTKCLFSNGYFNVREAGSEAVNVTLVSSTIPAQEWNRLRDKICNYLNIRDDVSVYFDYLMINGETDRFSSVMAGDWRRLGFSGNNIKNCVPSAPKEIISEANRFFHDNPHLLSASLLPERRRERVRDMVEKSYWTDEFKESAQRVRDGLRASGMDDKDITKFLDQIVIKSGQQKEQKVRLRRDLPESDIRQTESSAMDAVRDRIVTPSARSFTKEQVEVLNRYRSMFSADSSTEKIFNQLFDDAVSKPDVAAKPDKWKDDAWHELADLARGEERQEQTGIRL